MKKPSLKEKIAALRETFIHDLPLRVEDIDLFLHKFAHNPDNFDLLTELHRKIHNIKGTSASLGFSEINRASIDVDDLINNLQNQSEKLIDKDLQQLFVSFNQLKEIILKLMQCQNKNGHLSSDCLPSFDLSQQKSNTIARSPKHNKIIYICDDDPLQMAALDTQLQCFSYQTRLFSRPDDLFDALKYEQPDVIIVDIVFPDNPIGGIECVERLKTLTEHQIPIIFISARDDFEARMKAVQADGIAYFKKPFKDLEMVETLDKILRIDEPEPFKVLIVDDDQNNAEYHRLILSEIGLEVLTFDNIVNIFDVLNTFQPDIILMDMYMPVCNGMELAKLIRQAPQFISIPIVYLSSETDRQKQFNAVKVGADGFLTKPIDPQSLISEVMLRLERMAILRSLMIKDSLTGLLNHTTILNLLETELNLAKRLNKDLCFVMLDLDKFKNVNDTHGHAAGDQVLLALSRLLKQRLRNSDNIGRYGGEEFALVLPDTSKQTAFKIIDELRKSFHQLNFHSRDYDYNCSFSAGIASLDKQDVSIHHLINYADKALYQAKNKGRNCVVVSEKMD